MIDLERPHQKDSEIFDALVAAVRHAGVAPNRCEVTVRTVLESLTEHMAPAARDSFLRALPVDARALARPPTRRHHTAGMQGRNTLDLVRMAADLHDDDEAARCVVAAVLAVIDAP